MSLFLSKNIPLHETGLFSSLFLDYVLQNKPVSDLYTTHFSLNNFASYINTHTFSYVNRPVLVNALKQQAKLVGNTSAKTLSHIELLEKPNTYTVTTGHQLCLFTGPLYFIYKIVSTINLCKKLSEEFPEKVFVPIYWMASEDHDAEEINHIHVFGKTITWQTHQTGSVGEFNTQSISEAIAELKLVLGENENANYLIQLFEKAYLQHNKLSNATRYLVNELFGKYGLIILDGDDASLKDLFKNEFEKDAFENIAFEKVTQTIAQLQPKYHAQVTPRQINVFYKHADTRERVEKQGDKFVVVNTTTSFTKNELQKIINETPEKLSPNVVLRPLYQQKILPNIAYVGGPGELAYWLEYKTMFEAFQIHFPILVPRNFASIIDKGTQNKLQKLGLEISDVFKDSEELIKMFIKHQHNDVRLSEIKEQLSELYSLVSNTIMAIDKTLDGTVAAEKQKAINGISAIEQKINRALKQKSETDINQIRSIKEKLFPTNIPQERYDNFSMYYSKYGNEFIDELLKQFTYNLNNFSYHLLLSL